MQQSSYSNVVHKVMSSIYDYNDDRFPIKQQLTWLNYDMALSSMSSGKGRVQGVYPSPLPSHPLNLVGILSWGWGTYGVNSSGG